MSAVGPLNGQAQEGREYALELQRPQRPVELLHPCKVQPLAAPQLDKIRFEPVPRVLQNSLDVHEVGNGKHGNRVVVIDQVEVRRGENGERRVPQVGEREKPVGDWSVEGREEEPILRVWVCGSAAGSDPYRRTETHLHEDLVRAHLRRLLLRSPRR